MKTLIKPLPKVPKEQPQWQCFDTSVWDNCRSDDLAVGPFFTVHHNWPFHKTCFSLSLTPRSIPQVLGSQVTSLHLHPRAGCYCSSKMSAEKDTASLMVLESALKPVPAKAAVRGGSPTHTVPLPPSSQYKVHLVTPKASQRHSSGNPFVCMCIGML